MKTIWSSVAISLLLLVSVLAYAAEREHKPAAVEAGISVYFSPDGGCTQAIVQEIVAAKKSLQIQAYRLTSKPIAAAIVEAHRRGVKVSIILDKTQQSEKYSDATFYFNAGISVLIDKKHAIAHNKIMLVDEATIITGSFNFSAAAEESNAENLLVIKDKPELLKAYAANFAAHAKHAVPYEAPAVPK